jgi:hypothetical protein
VSKSTHDTLPPAPLAQRPRMPSRSHDDPSVLEADERRERELRIIAKERDALEALEARDGRATKAPESDHAELDRQVGKLVRKGAQAAPNLIRRIAPYLMTLLGGGLVGGVGAERTVAPSISGLREADAKKAEENDKRFTKLHDELERERARAEAIECRLLVLADQARRQGWDPQFKENREIELKWQGRIVDPTDPKERVAAPIWRSQKTCPDLPSNTAK